VLKYFYVLLYKAQIVVPLFVHVDNFVVLVAFGQLMELAVVALFVDWLIK